MAETVSLEQVYREVRKIEQEMVTKKDMDMMLETFSILSNPDTMRQILGSEEDIKNQRVKEINSVNDLLGEV